MKRLVICADGTWNERDQINKQVKRRRPTNVTKIALAIRCRASDGAGQIVFYHDGIGTRGPMDKATGGAFGLGMERNIRTLYRFIVYNHEPGDELYLFGFSRGAFTVSASQDLCGRWVSSRKTTTTTCPRSTPATNRAHVDRALPVRPPALIARCS